jgi:hypothetical protein
MKQQDDYITFEGKKLLRIQYKDSIKPYRYDRVFAPMDG